MQSELFADGLLHPPNPHPAVIMHSRHAPTPGDHAFSARTPGTRTSGSSRVESPNSCHR